MASASFSGGEVIITMRSGTGQGTTPRKRSWHFIVPSLPLIRMEKVQRLRITNKQGET